MNCPKCGSSHVNKKGSRRKQNRYVCRECNKWFSVMKEGHSSLEMTSKGNFVSEKLIEICEIDLKDPVKVLQAHGFDPECWTITAYRHNLWHAPIQGGKQTMYQSRVTVRPKSPEDLTEEDIDRFFDNFEPQALSLSKKPRAYDDKSDVLEVVFGDMHIDRLLYTETKAVEDKVDETVIDITHRMEGRKFSKAYLVFIGDIMNYDTAKLTTTNGTQQQSAGLTPYQAFDRTMYLILWIIDHVSVQVPVEVVFIPGNHDRLLSYALAKSIEAFYRNNEHVQVDAEHDYRKFRAVGDSLIGWMHGDMLKKNSHSWLQNEARELWGKTKYAEVHAGHYHAQTTLEKDGVIVRYLPSFSDPSLWEAEKGYMGHTQSTASFVWSRTFGLREMWFTNV